jgi:hypothetical protein
MATQFEHWDIILPILGSAFGGAVLFMAWTFKRLLGLERHVGDEMNATNQALAVLKVSQADLRKEFEKEASRNTTEHAQILDRMDANHERTMTRLDSILKIARNGAGKA